ncbi:uncharacterized protein Dwil_GK11397 [Drosophila willistoni]|uniref:Nucleolar pre-ribosomal-associated protein 1 n=1 Tax=Drosophila willistoni TaxID=7260 RepID=B4NAD5_DROWI|nr:uncharacterized protein LOC6647224 [Drosophila willistoni]EDW80749.1 uncharacterized protein Dwil_GK11397 [Drosophila willistoni]
MAIQPNRRKRKHAEATAGAEEQQDEGELAVPKKLAKESDTPQKQKKKKKSKESQIAPNDEDMTEAVAPADEHQEEEEETQQVDLAGSTSKKSRHKEDNEAEISPDSGIEPEEKAAHVQRFPNDFKMLNFRTKLRGNNFITELRHFLHMCQTTRPKLVAKYIEKRGKPLELAEAFERIDKNNILHVDYLTEALHRVVMEILSNQKSHMESAAHGCRYFLKSHGGVLEQLLQSTSPSHRRNALKLLTAIVCVEPQLGRQVLNSYDILSNVKTMEQMLSHSKNDYKNEETVRKAYIHFVLAFLVDGNSLLIRNILDRGQLIGVLARGLVYDDHVTVCVVVNALRQYVLENPDIQKTKKVLVFDLECLKNLRRLYDWLGPKGLHAMYCKKQKEEEVPEVEVKPEERQAVASAVHELLLMLLTSRKYGITFDAMTHYREKHNKVQGRLLGSLDKPFNNPLKWELVLKTLTACPDLGRASVRNFSVLINKAKIPRKDIPKACEFLAEVIATLPPSSLGAAMDKMTLTDLSFWIKQICLPVEAMIQIVGRDLLREDNFAIRLATNRLLLSMMQQYSNYMQAIELREQSKKAGNSLRKFKFDLLNHLLINFPNIDVILYSLYMSIQKQKDEDVDVLEHLSVTLDLILIMCKENKAFVKKTSQILDYLDVLRPLYEANFDKLKNNEDDDKIKLELKSIKTILMLFPLSLDPKEKLFEKVFRSFVKAYMLEDVAIKTEAGNLLNRLFRNTGIFDSCRHEIDIWLESLVCFDAHVADNVTDILLTILSLDWTEITLPELDMAETASNVKNLGKLFTQIEQGQTVQAFVETLTLSKMMPLLLEGVSLEEPYDAYVELVFILLFHYHTKPEQVFRLYNGHLTKYKNYLESWLTTGGQIKSLPKAVSKIWPDLNQLLEEISKPKDGKVLELIFKPKDEQKIFKLELEEGKNLQFDSSLSNPRRNHIYVQELLFVLTQLFNQQLLTQQQAELIADCLIRFLQIARQLDGNLLEPGKLQNLDEEQHVESHTENLLHYIYSIRLSQLRLTQLLSETNETHLNYIIFLRRLTEHCRSLPGFASHTANYRLQLTKSLEIGLATSSVDLDQQQLMECVSLVDAFELNAKECGDMLDLLMTKATAKDYFVAQRQNHYYDLLLRLLTRLATIKEPIDCSQSTIKLCSLYRDLNTQSESQLEPLETAFLQFLEIYHHHISSCDSEFFSTFFNPTRKLSKSAIKLASLLLERQPELAKTFIELLPDHLEQKELIYPLLDVAFAKKYELPQSLLQRCYQTYKSGFMKSIEKPQKAALIYREHSDASCALIALCMPKSECLDYCQKQLKLDSVELFQMKVLREIYWQALASSKDEVQRGTVFVGYINLQIQMLSLDLKKQSVEALKIEQMAWNCYEWWQQPQIKELQLDWSRLLNASHWINFCKSCLKTALHLSEDSQQQQQADPLHGLLLKLLAFLCDRLYEDYNLEDGSGQDGAEATPSLLYEMICTHSCSFDHLLGNQSEVKTQILNIMETLARKAPAALHSTHIPVILGAYQAKLSAADRYALALLEHYERFDVGLQQYRPFIWGESAVAHYALRATDEDERAKLQQQETNVAQVLALIVRQTCEYTIENFPIWRSLHAREQLPKLQFENPLIKFQAFGDNLLEQMVEQGVQEYSQELRRICPKRETIYENCYDPAFMVPLMLHCFAPESVVRARWPVQNGLLALSFCGLSSLDKDMRLAAANAQQRYRTHFELSKFYERPLWTQAYDNIQAGLSELRTSWLAQRRTHGGTPRVPLIPALFIAHSFNLSTEPTHLLYKRLMMYLRLKQSFNFQTIPDFNVFFYSPEPEHQQYREFIVELLRCGIKCSADLFLLVSTNTFKVLLGFYGCSMATLDTNLLLLSVLSTCVKIPGAVKIMLEHAGILPWLQGVIRDTEFHQFDIIEGIISIINNLWYALAASKSELPDYAHFQLRLHRLILQLLPMLSPRISVPALARLLNVLWKTATICGQHGAMSGDQLDQLLECLSRHWPDQLSEVRYVRSFGGSAACSRSEYCKWLANDQQLEVHAVLALSSLREYISDWWVANKKNITSTTSPPPESSTSTTTGVA